MPYMWKVEFQAMIFKSYCHMNAIQHKVLLCFCLICLFFELLHSFNFAKLLNQIQVHFQFGQAS